MGFDDEVHVIGHHGVVHDTKPILVCRPDCGPDPPERTRPPESRQPLAEPQRHVLRPVLADGWSHPMRNTPPSPPPRSPGPRPRTTVSPVRVHEAQLPLALPGAAPLPTSLAHRSFATPRPLSHRFPSLQRCWLSDQLKRADISRPNHSVLQGQVSDLLEEADAYGLLGAAYDREALGLRALIAKTVSAGWEPNAETSGMSRLSRTSRSLPAPCSWQLRRSRPPRSARA